MQFLAFIFAVSLCIISTSAQALCGQGGVHISPSVGSTHYCIYHLPSAVSEFASPFCSHVTTHGQIGYKWIFEKNRNHECPEYAERILPSKNETFAYCVWKNIGDFSKFTNIQSFCFIERGIIGYSFQFSNTLPLTCLVDNDNYTLTPNFRIQLHKETRERVIDEMIKRVGDDAAIYAHGVMEYMKPQLKDFLYMTGVMEDSFHTLIDLKTRKFILFAPELPKKELIWHYPKPPTLQEYKEKFGASEVYYFKSFNHVFHSMGRNNVHVLSYQDFPADYNYTKPNIIKSTLFGVLRDVRTTKTEKEIRVMKVAAKVSSMAHYQVMKYAKPGLYEYTMHSLYQFMTGACGLMRQAYDSIVGSGPHSAILHYIKNDAQIPNKPNRDFLLIDAGAEYLGYATDITRTYPASGRFTNDQKIIYNIVLETQLATIQMMRPGVAWSTLVKTAAITMLKGLAQHKFIINDVEGAYKAGIHELFQPHGLGHLVGLDVHDTYIYPTVLQKNMVLTIEPGVYFISVVFDDASELQKKFLNMEKIREFQGFGGVRIEDTLLITENGYEYLSNVPKTIDEIEKIKNS